MQLMVLRPVLGTNLYDKICTEYQADTLAGLYLQMHTDYIVPFLDRAVFSDYTTAGSYRSRNNGNLKITPNNAQSLDKGEDVRFMKQTMNKADFYLSELEKFLDDQGSNIPEYLVQINDYDTTPKDNDGFVIGWKL